MGLSHTYDKNHFYTWRKNLYLVLAWAVGQQDFKEYLYSCKSKHIYRLVDFKFLFYIKLCNFVAADIFSTKSTQIFLDLIFVVIFHAGSEKRQLSFTTRLSATNLLFTR